MKKTLIAMSLAALCAANAAALPGFYEIWIQTGNVAGAGTVSAISITLVNAAGKASPVVPLKFSTTFKTPFGPNQLDKFTVRLDTDLGPIKGIVVRSDGSGKEPEWYFAGAVVYWTPPKGGLDTSIPVEGDRNYTRFKFVNWINASNKWTAVVETTDIKATGLKAPTGLAAKAWAANEIVLTWRDNASNETGFRVEYCPSGTNNFTGYMTPWTTGPNVVTLDARNLQVGRSWDFRVGAYNATGTSGYSDIATCATPAATTVVAPTGLAGSALDTRSLKLTWRDNSFNEHRFEIESSDAQGGTYSRCVWTAANAVAYNVVAVNNGSTLLRHGTTYWFRVRAVNDSDPSAPSAWTAPVSVTTKTLPVPQAPTAQALSPSLVRLTWPAVDRSAYPNMTVRVDRSTDNVTFAPVGNGVAGTAVTFDDRWVTPGKTYYYQLKTSDESQFSQPSPVGQIAVPLTVEVPAPTSLVATADAWDTVRLRWTYVASIGTFFKVERSTSGPGADFTQINATVVDANSRLNGGCAPSTTYWYRVKAQNANGESQYSNVASVRTPFFLPAPTSLGVTGSTRTSVQLSWIDNRSGYEQGFKVEKATSASGPFTDAATVGLAGANSFQYSVSNLNPGTTCWFRVCAYLGNDKSGYTNIVSATTEGVPIPAPPSNLQVGAITTDSVQLSWTHDAASTRYFIILQSNQQDSGFRSIDQVDASVKSCAARNLVPGTTYWFKVTAKNSENQVSADSNTVRATTNTAPPAAPSNFRALNPTTNTILLDWVDNSNNEKTFQIERSTQANSGFLNVGHVDANVRTFTSTNLAPDTAYWFRVLAQNDTGSSAWSNTANATTARDEATLKIVNNTKYAIVDLAVNGQQKLTQATAIPTGQSRDFTITPTGTVNYVLGAGMYSGNVKTVLFQKSGSATLSFGQTATVTYANPTIAEVMGNFGSQATWTGTVAGVKVRFVFSSAGTWKYYNSMTATTPTSSGNVTLASWGNNAASCVFTLNSTWKDITLTFKPASFDLPLEFNNTVVKFTLVP
ncbi:MAG: fibronectin type III domain-containing protein [Spirochaetes bacterium]|nr:fibronectin type III domain-containing protein [Spirochaetota bacterium]